MSQYEYVRIKPKTRSRWDKKKLEIENLLGKSIYHHEFADLILDIIDHTSPRVLKTILKQKEGLN